MTTADLITRVGRAPKGGMVSPVNGRFYKGGWFMPLEANPAPSALRLAADAARAAKGSRERRLARLEREANAAVVNLSGFGRRFTPAEAARFDILRARRSRIQAAMGR